MSEQKDFRRSRFIIISTLDKTDNQIKNIIDSEIYIHIEREREREGESERAKWSS